MANPEPAATGLLSIAAAAIATGGAILQGVWRGRDEREKEERTRKERLEEEEAAAVSERLRKLEEKMHAQELASARQDEVNRAIEATLSSLDRKVDRLDEKVDRLLSERAGSSPGVRR